MRPRGWVIHCSLRLLTGATLLAACGPEFTGSAPAQLQLTKGALWRDSLTVADTVTVQFALESAGEGQVVAPRASWQSSNEQVVRVESIAISGDPTADSLAARRTRVRLVAVGPGRASLVVATEARPGLPATQQTFTVTVLPLRIVRVNGRSALSATDVDTMRVRVLRASGDTAGPLRLTWTSSDDQVLRVEPLSANTGDRVADTLAARRQIVRLVARGRGRARLTVSVERTPSLVSTPDTTFDIDVSTLTLEKVDGRLGMSFAEASTWNVKAVRADGSTQPNVRLTWMSSDERVVRVEPLSPVNEPAADTLIARRLRVRVVALARGTAQSFHECFIETGTGALYCVGANTNGQIGDGTTISRSAPVRVREPAGRL